MEKVFYVAIYFVLASVIGLGIILIHLILSEKPKESPPQKFLPFESGMIPFHDARGRLPVKFYVFALAFLIFDIEVALLIPYIPIVKELGIVGIAEVLFFLLVLFFGYLYIREVALKQKI
ncbi:MAG: NADH-quinone oxidoreductase subunit A [Candidatus Calescibacterium sp.]|nr:NADH-quinone oxidoreductase subunit A [Candidatus Calescibacterium sp.]MDW8086362.1 NADH-quinone oxidoreductase subunit A [Candidatus Calescibacterium sp.]